LIAPQEQLGTTDASKDLGMAPISEQVAEDTRPTVEEEDPIAIFSLQERLFNSSDHTDSILETRINLKAHIRTASLNINCLTERNLPIILTYIKKKKVDVITLQDTRLVDKDSQLIAMPI